MFVIWLLSVLTFAGAVWIGQRPALGGPFRLTCLCLGIIGLGPTLCGMISPVHLLWYTPIAIAGAFAYRLRRLIALSRRIDRIAVERLSNPEELRQIVEREVQDYNKSVPDEQRLK